jgi:Transglycosylase SLT domain
VRTQIGRRAPWIWLAGTIASALGVLLVPLLISVVVLSALAGHAAGASAPSGAIEFSPSARALADIPPAYLTLYERAAQRYGLDWTYLAAIGKLECDHGRATAAACRREGAVNYAGAGGPAQFLASTWRAYGVDGDGDGVADRWNAADAIYSMANYLHASGAPEDYGRALFAYNHLAWYVNDVEQWASTYRGPRMISDPSSSDGVAPTPPGGDRAVLSPGDGHTALISSDAPAAVQAMVAAGNELQALPYGPEGHPNPLGAPDQDCSSTVNYVLYRAGVRSLAEIVRENPLAQSYPNWGLSGPGRWVSIYATTSPTDHVFIVIAGLRLDTSHNGTDVGPNRDQDGPRWRILDHIPTWAHWSVRHPPGL